MKLSEFVSRVRSVVDEHGMEALVREAPSSVIVLYPSLEEFAARAPRDVAALSRAFDGTAVKVAEFDAGAWNRPEMPRYRAVVQFDGVDTQLDRQPHATGHTLS